MTTELSKADKPKKTYKCLSCGKTGTVFRAPQKFCSPACRFDFHNIKRKKYIKDLEIRLGIRPPEE